MLSATALLAFPAYAFATGQGGACGGPVPLAASTLDDLGIDPALFDPSETGITACAGLIQPGAQMTRPVGCTMNWIFQDETGALYIGTAGHCLGATNAAPKDVHLRGVGFIGRSVWNVNAGIGNDFGLVKIDPSVYHLVDPTLCHWGGPTKQAEFPGAKTVETEGEQTLLQYGYGFMTSASAFTRGRVQYTHSYSANTIKVDGFISSGDSGSPNMFADGGAAGIITHADVGVPGAAFGTGYAVRIDRGIALANAATGHTFTLVTSETPVDFPTGSLI